MCDSLKEDHKNEILLKYPFLKKKALGENNDNFGRESDRDVQFSLLQRGYQERKFM